MCALELGCWCRCRVPLQGAAAAWMLVPLQRVAARCLWQCPPPLLLLLRLLVLVLVLVLDVNGNGSVRLWGTFELRCRSRLLL